jgi:hypothetical protein
VIVGNAHDFSFVVARVVRLTGAIWVGGSTADLFFLVLRELIADVEVCDVWLHADASITCYRCTGDV